jgi:protocatechuate 3,4-dioxygenase beta subunit
MHEHEIPLLTRRRALGLLGAAGLGAVAAACGGDSSSSGAGARTTTTAVTPSSTAGAGSSSSASCVLTPEATEGPFYLDADLVRSDITEGKAGTPVELAITVVDADGCAPVRDATVDIWHCDAEGVYSGFESASTGGPGGGGSGATDSTRFLRGTQVTGADGVVTFRTIYPGWYRGRAVHIHMKVHVDSSTRHTGQLFFADDLNESVFAASPYADRGSPDMRNDDDDIYGEAGGRSAEVTMSPSGDGYRGTITVGIRQR